MTFCVLSKRSSATLCYVLFGLMALVQQSFALVVWDTSPTDIDETWNGNTAITASSTGVVDAVRNNGNARNFRAKGRGNPSPGNGNPFELSAVGVVDPLVITTTTFNRTTAPADSGELLENQRTAAFSGGDNVGVEVEIDISQNNLLAAEAGIYTGTIDLCIGNVNVGCNVGNNNTDEATLDITIEIDERVIVSGLGDFNGSGSLSYSPGNDATGTSTFCIGSNTGGVTIEFSSEAGSGYGLVGDNSSEDLPYTLTLTGGGTAITVPAVDVESDAFTNGVDNLVCDDNNMVLTMTVLETVILQAGDTDFSETLQVLVKPD